MIWKRKKRASEPVTEPPKIVSETKLQRIVKCWNHNRAANFYRFEYAIRRTFDDGNVDYKIAGSYARWTDELTEECWQYTSFEGDYAWAQRTAEHYGIEMPPRADKPPKKRPNIRWDY